MFWLVMLVALVAVFNALNLTMVSGPLSGLLQQLADFAPRLLAAGALAFVAWVVASVLKLLVGKLLDKTTLDEQLAAFPYVNGKLFDEPLPMADFSRAMPATAPMISSTMAVTFTDCWAASMKRDQPSER